mgnify:CR=1 FL=1
MPGLNVDAHWHLSLASIFKLFCQKSLKLDARLKCWCQLKCWCALTSKHGINISAIVSKKLKKMPSLDFNAVILLPTWHHFCCSQNCQQVYVVVMFLVSQLVSCAFHLWWMKIVNVFSQVSSTKCKQSTSNNGATHFNCTPSLPSPSMNTMNYPA